MAGNTRFISFNDVHKHPDDSILLAYHRGQKLEFRSSYIQHIDIEKCPRCLQKLNELKQVSTTLDVLGDMPPYQHYPELSVADTYARMQNALHHRIPAKAASNGAYNRQRPRKSAVRLISVPVAFVLAILFTVAMLVFANLSGRSLIPFSVDGGTSNVQNTLTIGVSPHPKSTQAATAIVSPTGTPCSQSRTYVARCSQAATAIVSPTGAPEAKGPEINVCSTQANIDQLRLVICGSNFDSTHKANLFVYMPGKIPVLYRNIPVDKLGKFQIGWKIADCGNVPTYIIGYEVASSRSILAKLQITSFGSCTLPTITPVAASSRGFTNFW